MKCENVRFCGWMSTEKFPTTNQSYFSFLQNYVISISHSKKPHWLTITKKLHRGESVIHYINYTHPIECNNQRATHLKTNERYRYREPVENLLPQIPNHETWFNTSWGTIEHNILTYCRSKNCILFSVSKEPAKSWLKCCEARNWASCLARNKHNTNQCTGAFWVDLKINHIWKEEGISSSQKNWIKIKEKKSNWSENTKSKSRKQEDSTRILR